MATAPPGVHRVTDLFDLICVNRYYGWYTGAGDLEAAAAGLTAELRAWAQRASPSW